jgi:hypothetical protein
VIKNLVVLIRVSSSVESPWESKTDAEIVISLADPTPERNKHERM